MRLRTVTAIAIALTLGAILAWSLVLWELTL